MNEIEAATDANIRARLEAQIKDNPVLLYMKGTPDFPQCGFSARVVAILNALETRFAYVNILEDPELREALKQHSQWPTYPQLYVGGELLGGCDIAVEMYESGELAEAIGAGKV